MAPSGVFVLYAWTWPNYPADADAQLKAKLRPHRNIKRVSYQSELSPTTGMPHLQGYILCVMPCQKATALNYMPGPRTGPGTINGTNFFTSGKSKGPEHWDAYTAKDASYDSVAAIRTAWGHWDLSDVAQHEANCQKGKGQGNRSDHDFIGAWLRAGKSFEQLTDLAYTEEPDASMAMKLIMANGTQARMAAAASIRNRRTTATLDLECLWLWGESGSGKTRYAHDLAAERNQRIFTVPDPNGSSHFFDGLAGQEILLVDDFDGSSMKFRKLLTFCDIYPGALLPIKGASVYNTAKTIIFTSDSHPRDIFSKKAEELGADGIPKIVQLYRRFDSSKKLKRRVKNGQPDGIKQLFGAPVSESEDSDSEADDNPWALPAFMTAPGGQFA